MLHAIAGMQPKIFWVATKHGLSRDLVVFSPWIKVSDPEEIQSCQGCLEHNHLIRCQGRPLSAYLEWDTPGSLPKNFGLGQRPKYPGKTWPSSLDLILSHSTSARRGRPRLASAQVARPPGSSASLDLLVKALRGSQDSPDPRAGVTSPRPLEDQDPETGGSSPCPGKTSPLGTRGLPSKGRGASAARGHPRVHTRDWSPLGKNRRQPRHPGYAGLVAIYSKNCRSITASTTPTTIPAAPSETSPTPDAVLTLPTTPRTVRYGRPYSTVHGRYFINLRIWWPG